MSKESALKFLNTLGKNERAKELLKDRQKPESLEDQAKIYSEIASELGEQISPEDFKLAVEEIEEQIKKKTEAAASDLEALEDNQVKDVAGGYYYLGSGYCVDYQYYVVEDQCKGDFKDTSCWFSDACDNKITLYYDCNGNYLNYG